MSKIMVNGQKADIVGFKINGIDYSLEEKVIGTWFDKPLYQKTFKSTVTRSSITYVDFDLSSLDIQEIMYDLSGSYISLNGTKQGYIVPFLSRKENYDLIYSLEFIPSTKMLHIQFANNWVATSGTMSIVFTIRYTKTTD